MLRRRGLAAFHDDTDDPRHMAAGPMTPGLPAGSGPPRKRRDGPSVRIASREGIAATLPDLFDGLSPRGIGAVEGTVAATGPGVRSRGIPGLGLPVLAP